MRVHLASLDAELQEKATFSTVIIELYSTLTFQTDANLQYAVLQVHFNLKVCCPSVHLYDAATIRVVHFVQKQHIRSCKYCNIDVNSTQERTEQYASNL
jgi:hypothetical protein